MPDFGFKADIAETVRELLADTLEQSKASSAAISRDGHVFRDALPNLGWYSYTDTIPGAVTSGANLLRWPFPQGGVIRRVSIDARSAPSGGNFEFTLTGGGTAESFSLQPGETFKMVPANIVMPAGSWARINVTSASGVNDVLIALQYESAGSGGTSGSGGGSGGGGGTAPHSYAYADLTGKPILGDLAAKDEVTVADIDATGTASGSTFLAGDGSWKPVSGGGGAVDSVNGQNGTVDLDADDIDATGTRLWLTPAERTKITNTSGTNSGDQDLSDLITTSELASALTVKANTADLGTAAAQNSSAFATATQGSNADTAVQPGDLATVATSGDYDDLAGKPTIPTVPASIVETVSAGANITVDNTDPANPVISTGGAAASVTSVNGATGVVVLDADDIADTASNILMSPAERTKLSGIADGAEANVQSDWSSGSGDSQILNKPTIPNELVDLDTTVSGSQLNAMKSKLDTIETHSVSNQQSPGTAVTSTNISTTYSPATVLQTTTLGAAIPAITTGTWDVDVIAHAILWRSVSGGGTVLHIGNGTTSQEYSISRGFPQTGGCELTVQVSFKGITSASTIDMRMSGFSAAGTTSCMNYGWQITARRVS